MFRTRAEPRLSALKSGELNRCEPRRVELYPIKRGDSARLNAVTNTDGSSFHAREADLGCSPGRRSEKKKKRQKKRKKRQTRKRRRTRQKGGDSLLRQGKQFDLLSPRDRRERRGEEEGADVDYDRRTVHRSSD